MPGYWMEKSKLFLHNIVRNSRSEWRVREVVEMKIRILDILTFIFHIMCDLSLPSFNSTPITNLCLLGKNQIIFHGVIIKVQFYNQNDSLQKPITFNIIGSSLMLNRKFHQSTFLKTQWVGKSTRDILNFKLVNFTLILIILYNYLL